jgi:hypothetical protein
MTSRTGLLIQSGDVLYQGIAARNFERSFQPQRSHQFCLHGAAPVRLAGPASAPLAGWGQAPVRPAGPPPVYLAGLTFSGRDRFGPLVAIRRASSQVSSLAAARLPGLEIDVGGRCNPGFSNAAFSDAPPCQIVLRAFPVGLATQSTGSYLRRS